MNFSCITTQFPSRIMPGALIKGRGGLLRLGACTLLALSGCNRSDAPARVQSSGVEARAAKLDAMLSAKAAAAPPALDRRVAPPVDGQGPQACSYLTNTEMSTLTGAVIGVPVPSASDTRTSCTYPAADASAAQIAKIVIDREPSGVGSVESELSRVIRSHNPRHAVKLGEAASFGGTVLTIRLADARVAVKVAAGSDAEARATAIGKLLVERMTK